MSKTTSKLVTSAAPAAPIRIVAIRHRILHALAEVVLRLAVHHRDFVAGFEQFGDQQPADKQRAADNQDFHGRTDLLTVAE